MAADFQPAWLIVSAISALSCIVFWRMPSDAGAALAERAPEPAVGPAALAATTEVAAAAPATTGFAPTGASGADMNKKRK
jgi:hypothetical protein